MTRRCFSAHDLVRLARVQDPQLAPDGRGVAFVLRETDLDNNCGRTAIWWLALSGKRSAPRRIIAGAGGDSSPRWSRDARTLYFLSRRSGSAQVWALDAGFGEARAVTALPLDVTSFRVSPDGGWIAVSMEVFAGAVELDAAQARLQATAAAKGDGQLYERLFVRHWDQWSGGRRSHLYLAALGDQVALTKARAVAPALDADIPSKPFGDDAEYAFSPDSRRLVFGARVAGAGEAWSTNFDLYEVDCDGGTPRNLTPDNPAWDAHPVFSPDGSRLYYLAMRRPGFEADRFAIIEKVLASGATREVAPDWDRSAAPLRISPDGRTLYTTADDDGQHPLFAIDIASGAATRVVADGHVGGFSLEAGRLVVARDCLCEPADLFEVDPAGGALRRLTEVNAAALEEVDFGAVEPFEFAGWNGERVRGYVVAPARRTPGERYPVAFLIHGGPQGSWINDFHYRWNPQVYAGAGFGVVVVDFHGSTGYGQAFTDSITGDWGGKPLEDLQKGFAAALERFEWLDGSRAAALGASYGGYMVNWMAGHWKEPWRCFVSHCGVFDSRMMYYSTDELWFDEWEHQALPWEQPERYEQCNPVTAVGRWSVPMLVIHGGNDFRIPLEQGLATFTALQRRGIPSQFLYFPGESHWVSAPHNSVQWHDTVLAWLRRWTAS